MAAARRGGGAPCAGVRMPPPSSVRIRWTTAAARGDAAGPPARSAPSLRLHNTTMATAPERLEMNGAADWDGEAEVLPRGRRYRQQGPLNMNHYANKKSAAESMLDVALLMANASQLKAVMEQGSDFSFYIPLITLISMSLILQILVGIMLIFIVKWNLNDESLHYRLNILENVATALVFVIVVVNVFITAFGVQRPAS